MLSITLLRLVAWLYPLTHAWLWWQQTVNPLIYFGCFIIAFILSSIVPLTFKKRYYPLFWIALLVALPFLIRFGVRLIEVVSYGSQPVLLASFDFSFIPSIMIMALFFTSNYLVRKIKGYRPFEIFTRLALLIAAYWAMERYKLVFYSRHDFLIAFLALYLVVEASLLILTSGNSIKKSSFFLTMALLVLPLLTILPVVFNRISAQMGQYSSGLLVPTLSSFDFAKTVQLESEIDLGNELILILKIDPPITKKELIKRYTLAGYSAKKGFYTIDGYGDIDYLPPFPVTIDQNSVQGRKVLEQEVYLINLESKALVAANRVEQIIPYQSWNESSFKRVYKVTSQVIDDDLALLEEATNDGLTEDERTVYLATGDHEAIENLAHQVTAGLSSPYLRALAINNFFRNNYIYSLKPGIASSGEQIEHFLFESQRGYCSYFAFSMALMLRYLDIPARVATGFWVDPKIETMGYYPIQSNLAHAWVEVYFDDYGWVNFDPTSERLDPYELNSGFNGQLASNVDGLIDEINKNRLYLNPTASDLSSLSPPQKNRDEAGLAHQSANFLIIFLLIVVLKFYFIAVFIFRRRFWLPYSGNNTSKVVKMCKRLYFHQALAGRSESFGQFLAQHKDIAVIYRKALYSNTFCEEDFLKFSQYYHDLMLNCYQGFNGLQKVWLLVTPRQFFIGGIPHE